MTKQNINQSQATMKTIEEQTREIANALHESVAEALEIKSRLGQYAVVWDDKLQKVVKILPKAKPISSKRSPK